MAQSQVLKAFNICCTRPSVSQAHFLTRLFLKLMAKALHCIIIIGALHLTSCAAALDRCDAAHKTIPGTLPISLSFQQRHLPQASPDSTISKTSQFRRTSQLSHMTKKKAVLSSQFSYIYFPKPKAVHVKKLLL